MRRLSSFLFIAAFSIAACNNNKPKEVTITSQDGKEKVTIDPTQNSAAAMQQMMGELQKLTPLSLDQLKALVPEELMGVKRSSYNASSAMGAGMADAEYKINDSSRVHLVVYDCAGPGGVGIYSMQFMGLMNMQKETETESLKTIDYNGGRAVEDCHKDRNECSFTYFSGGRFMVALDGNNVGIDALKEAAGGLKIK